jgi:hypothetical protein
LTVISSVQHWNLARRPIVARDRHTTRSRRVYIGEKRWQISHVRYPRDRDGDCNWSKRLIRVAANLRGLHLADALIHEITHARFPDLAEESVEEFASTVAGILAAEGLLQEDD